MKIRITTLIVGILFVLALIYFLFFWNIPIKNSSSNAQEKILLDKILTEIKSDTFTLKKCGELLTFSLKQICYKAFIARKITKNEILDKNVCYNLIENSDKQVCLEYSPK